MGKGRSVDFTHRYLIDIWEDFVFGKKVVVGVGAIPPDGKVWGRRGRGSKETGGKGRE